VANQIDPDMLRFEDNLNDLRQRLTIPFLGLLPYAPAGVSQSNAKAIATKLCQQIF
jgi:dethiobiotin synthetase